MTGKRNNSHALFCLFGEQGLIRHPIFGCYDISLFHDITSDVVSITFDGFEKKAHAAKPLSASAKQLFK
jgi:hypothetical protein